MADADALRDATTCRASRLTPEPTPPPATAPDGSVMSLVDHLGELRDRLFRVILAVVAGSVVGFYFADADPEHPPQPDPGRDGADARTR